MKDVGSFKSDEELNSFLRSLNKKNFEVFIAKTVHDV
jgi:hypothetical protein